MTVELCRVLLSCKKDYALAKCGLTGRSDDNKIMVPLTACGLLCPPQQDIGRSENSLKAELVGYIVLSCAHIVDLGMLQKCNMVADS